MVSTQNAAVEQHTTSGARPATSEVFRLRLAVSTVDFHFGNAVETLNWPGSIFGREPEAGENRCQ